MAGASIQCGEFAGHDKSGSPIGAVLAELYRRAFGRPPRGKIGRWFGSRRTGLEAVAEDAIVAVRFDAYQREVLSRLGVRDDVDQILSRRQGGSRAKYGGRHDDAWHAYCLHDLTTAFAASARTRAPVDIRRS